jgi:hypothetical protein
LPLNIGSHYYQKLLLISACNYSHRPISVRYFHCVVVAAAVVVVVAELRRVCIELSQKQKEKTKENYDSNNANDRPFLRLMSMLPKRIQLFQLVPPLRN